ADVVPAEVHVHEAGHELVVRRILVVLDPLEERVGAVPYADEGDADAIVQARLSVLLPVDLSHREEPPIASLLCIGLYQACDTPLGKPAGRWARHSPALDEPAVEVE